jgi:hypothetical protein
VVSGEQNQLIAKAAREAQARGLLQAPIIACVVGLACDPVHRNVQKFA